MKAEALAQQLSGFPQSCMRADRISVKAQHGLIERDGLYQEWWNSKLEVSRGIEGAGDFVAGAGRGGSRDGSSH